MGQATTPILDVVAIAASVYAGPEIGSAILNTMGVTDATAATTAAVGAAAVSGTSSAVNTAIQGGDVNQILKAGAEGAAAGAAGSEVASALAPTQTPLTTAAVGPAALSVEGVAERAGTSALSGAVGGATQAALSGKQNLTGAAEKGAEVGGLASLGTQGINAAYQAGQQAYQDYAQSAGQGLAPSKTALGTYDLTTVTGNPQEGYQVTPGTSTPGYSNVSGTGLNLPNYSINADGTINFGTSQDSGIGLQAPRTDVVTEQYDTSGLSPGAQSALQSLIGFGIGQSLASKVGGAGGATAGLVGSGVSGTQPTTGESTSPSEVIPAGGVEDPSTGGRRTNVWNVESLREGLNF